MKPNAGTMVVVSTLENIASVPSRSPSLPLARTHAMAIHTAMFQETPSFTDLLGACDVVEPRFPRENGFIHTQCHRICRASTSSTLNHTTKTARLESTLNGNTISCFVLSTPSHHRVAPKPTLTLRVRKKSQTGEREVPWKRRLLLPTRSAYALQAWEITSGTCSDATAGKRGGRNNKRSTIDHNMRAFCFERLEYAISFVFMGGCAMSAMHLKMPLYGRYGCTCTDSVFAKNNRRTKNKLPRPACLWLQEV